VVNNHPPFSDSADVACNGRFAPPWMDQGAMRRRLLLNSACLLLSCSIAAAAFAASPTLREDQIVRHWVDAQQFMGAVLVARGDKILFEKAYGSANLEWNIPNTTATRFRIASITKQFTAAAILLLEERGKLKVEDPISKYYADAPAAWSRITLLNLLQHTSGIPDFAAEPDVGTWMGQRTTPADSVKRVRDKPLQFEPGTDMRYSNTGYLLLGIAIEKASGTSYAAFLKESIFELLGMKDTGYDENEPVLPRRASGYSPGPSTPVNAKYTDMTNPFAAGGLYSTVEDLLRWERGLFGKKVLSESSLEKMTTPGRNDYGFGLYVTEKAGRVVIHHGGGIAGFNSQLAYYPKDRVTVVVLSNLNGFGADKIADQLSAVVHGETVVLPPRPKSVPVAKSILDKYVGTYQVGPGVNLWFTIEGDRLKGQATGQPPFFLTAESETQFAPTAFEGQIEFRMDASGKVTNVIVRQDGRDSVAPRVSDLGAPK
jgi:CubicO group peptidase (beta-lactamase class C family)